MYLFMPLGIRGAAQTALLGPEGEAFLQRLGQIHELWTHCYNGKEHIFQNMSSAFMLLWFLHLVMVCLSVCSHQGMARAGCSKDRQKDAWRDKPSGLSPRHYQRRLLRWSGQVSLCVLNSRQTDRQTDRERETGRQTDRQTDRWTV